MVFNGVCVVAVPPVDTLIECCIDVPVEVSVAVVDESVVGD